MPPAPLPLTFSSPMKRLAWCLALVFSLDQSVHAIDNIVFNIDVLDVKDRANIDLSRFSRPNYIMPGSYPMILRVNTQELPEQTVQFIAPQDDPQDSLACLTPQIVNQLGLKADVIKDLSWWHDGQCLQISSLKGMEVRGNLAEGALYISMPQAYLEYTAENWDPPSRWDEGSAGVIFDYSLNTQTIRQSEYGNNNSLSGNGTLGANLGPWRLRADWQAQRYRTAGKTDNTQKHWEWSRYYAYRAIPALGAKLTLGEDYLNSSIFDSFRFTGASLATDDNMLPPNLRGYAPEVSGVARTNAKVTISQQGRVIYETLVAAGPFRIQDLTSAISGRLDVKVQEQDGSVQTFQIDTANIPYLTRPGLVRYKVAAGRPSDNKHHHRGSGFVTGEFSWGVNSGWSLYSGALLGQDYNALSMGIGRDLFMFGALSFDVTQSRASFPHETTRRGESYRLSYSKRFEQYDSQITFASYRFSERDFMSMTQYLNERYDGVTSGNSKALYTVTFNKNFRDLKLSTYLNYNRQTYWDRPANSTYNLSLSHYFNLGPVKNASLNLTLYRNQYNNSSDKGAYLSISIPWGSTGIAGYNGQFNQGKNTNTVEYYDRIDGNSTYRIRGGMGPGGRAVGSVFLTHDADWAEVTANASTRGRDYQAAGLSLKGGITATSQGAALHRITIPGDTRMMVDTEGVSGVPVRGYGNLSHTNLFGKAVVSDVNSYYRNSVSVDMNKLADNVEATRSVVQGTLTQGAIGYRKFGVIAGEKAMAVIRLPDGSAPPFGAVVMNAHQMQAGLVNDGGSVWLTGIKPGATMEVNWDGETQCLITIPSPLPTDFSKNLLLSCRPVESTKTRMD